MTQFERVFIDAYEEHVGGCPRNLIEIFITDKEEDYYHTYKDHYTSLSDAYNVFKAGIEFGLHYDGED